MDKMPSTGNEMDGFLESGVGLSANMESYPKYVEMEEFSKRYIRYRDTDSQKSTSESENSGFNDSGISRKLDSTAKIPLSHIQC